MYRGRRVAVVMPAYNVEAELAEAIATVPSFVDQLIVVDDASCDATPRILAEARCGPDRSRLIVLTHSRNRGVGAAITSGYRAALAHGAEIVAVMAGDAQMDPVDLPALLDPLVEQRADYAKGNRFKHVDVWRVMPRWRQLGNVVLSLLTRVTAGYGKLFDSQCGYTAISAAALRAVGDELYPRYGYPNDLLARLKTVGARVADVPVRPIYAGERSGIRPWTVLYPILFVLIGSMVRRLRRGRARDALRREGLETRAARRADPRGRLARQTHAEATDADRRPDHLLPAPPR